MINQFKLAFKAIKKLQQQGFDVQNVCIGKGRPTITVTHDHKCQQLQENGKAGCYMFSTGQRSWQMPVNNCRVVWHVR